MKLARAGALTASVVLGVSLSVSAVSAQSESATAEDGKPASEAPAETSTAPEVPLGANLTPPLGALPLGPAIISGPGSGQPGSSSVSMAPGTLTAGTAREGANAVRAPEAEPAPAPAPVIEAALEPVTDSAATETSETVVADTAVATESDRDADNYADALEWDLGLDPNDADTDEDGVADGDELNIYGTSPTVFDTDGDGASDGEELFGILTDPLVWDDFTAASGAVGAQESTEAVGTSE
jgi:Bacterial TSP3 repeat